MKEYLTCFAALLGNWILAFSPLIINTSNQLNFSACRASMNEAAIKGIKSLHFCNCTATHYDLRAKSVNLSQILLLQIHSVFISKDQKHNFLRKHSTLRP